MLSQAFENCRIGTNCVTFNPEESRVRITESGAAVLRTHYNPATSEKPLQNGYKFNIPSLNGFRLSAPNGETSVGPNASIRLATHPTILAMRRALAQVATSFSLAVLHLL